MAKLIRACAWRRLERPYTRKSKYRKKSFVRAVPANKIVKFEMGNTKAQDFQYKFFLISKENVQLRHNALESVRKTSNKILEKKCGKLGYLFKIRVYPHHMLRNNPLAAGAGADRMSTGMKMSFGKVVGIAAQVKKGQPVIEVRVNKENIPFAKDAMDRARNKIPGAYSVVMEEVKASAPKASS
ncbi:50S ribosomal protein L16 [Candidatus Woesearchaeota archaeon]|nr:50S ribosomal protein L16 [Candidatus Woesearchaeota archaeon]